MANKKGSKGGSKKGPAKGSGKGGSKKGKGRAPVTPDKKLPVFPIVMVLVVILGATAIVLAWSQSKKKQELITPEVSVSGAPLPMMSDTPDPADPARGMIAPTVEGLDFEGKKVSITNDGQPKVILFLAHWCPHCQKEVPIVVKWMRENQIPPGVGFYSIATGNDEARPNYPPNQWLKREGWTVPVILDDKRMTIANSFGLRSYPYWVLTDSTGRVVTRFANEQTADELTQMFVQMQALTAGGQAAGGIPPAGGAQEGAPPPG